jgi:hypothetical protein
MVTLQTDTPNQTLRLTLSEAIVYLPTFSHYLMSLHHEENSSAGASKYQIPSLILENQRYSEIVISTEDLLLAGRYRYQVWGQNSSTNLDPDAASVVGLVERGWILLLDDQSYYSIPDIPITNDIIYG